MNENIKNYNYITIVTFYLNRTEFIHIYFSAEINYTSEGFYSHLYMIFEPTF